MVQRRKTVYRSRNRYREFLKAAKCIAGKVSKIDGVVGILGTGCIGRGHCDDYSDLDLIVYAHRRACKYLDKNIEFAVSVDSEFHHVPNLLFF